MQAPATPSDAQLERGWRLEDGLAVAPDGAMHAVMDVSADSVTIIDADRQLRTLAVVCDGGGHDRLMRLAEAARRRQMRRVARHDVRRRDARRVRVRAVRRTVPRSRRPACRRPARSAAATRAGPDDGPGEPSDDVAAPQAAAGAPA